MAHWYGIAAATGGLIALLEWIPSVNPPWLSTLGGLGALIFGIFAAYSD